MKKRKFACSLALLILLPILFSTSCKSYWQEPLGVHPQPNAEDVRYYTTLSVTLPKDYELIEIRTKPFVEIAHVGEYIMDSETIKFVGYPADILEYETTYHVNVEFKIALEQSIDMVGSSPLFAMAVWDRNLTLNQRAITFLQMQQSRYSSTDLLDIGELKQGKNGQT